MTRADLLREAAEQRVESTPELLKWKWILVDLCVDDQPADYWAWLASADLRNVIQCAEYFSEP